MSLAWLLAAVPAYAQSVSWNTPMAYSYQDGDNYVVVPYEIENNTGSIKFNSLEIVLQTQGGKQLDDGFHPFVKAAFCKAWPSSCPGGVSDVKDALTARVDLLPGSRFNALAIFELNGDFPDALTMAFKTFDRLRRRTSYTRNGTTYEEAKATTNTKCPKKALDPCLKACGEWSLHMDAKTGNCRQDCIRLCPG